MTLLCTCWWEGVLYEDEDRLLGTKLDPLADDVDELSNCEIGRNKVPVCSQVLGAIHLDSTRNVHYSLYLLVVIK